ncbi:PREDICTED: uncharacterized protein LOC109359686 [Lupinus angustifolius]|uniref:uncharacterized protein LOC109359686 n=1 Tax=Lupinus angustifolius TaxID=3871 RepID=UPI00092E459B|nr:PREDICTED: uncharacterized protein LOC109359686 [Lupinus angustifolius]
MEQPTPQAGMNGHDEDPTYEPPPRVAFNKFAPHNSRTHHKQTTRVAQFGDDAGVEKLNLIEERLRAIEGASFSDLKNAFEMCLVPDVVLPPKFKVLPRLEEEEQISIFVDTLQNIYYDHLVVVMASGFNALIGVGEKIEIEIKSGKIIDDQENTKKLGFMKKKEGETHFISNDSKKQLNNNYLYHSRTNNYQHQQSRTPNNTYTTTTQNRGYTPQDKRTVFDTIHVPYADIFTYLMGERIIAPISGRIPENPGPWFDPNVSCAYHYGIVEHSIENCRALKFKVQHLIDSKWLNFRQSTPNVSNNPLPNHGNHGVNDVEEVQEEYFLKDVSEIYTSMKVIFKELCNQGMIGVVKETEEGEGCCEMHGLEGHVIEDCAKFKMLLQKMMDTKLMVVGRRSTCPEVNVVEDNDDITTFIPTLVQFEPILSIPMGISLDLAQPQWFPYLTKMEPIVIDIPHPRPYESDKAVPWRYSGEVITLPGRALEVTNVVGVRRITRSGRVYGPLETGKNTVTIYKGKKKFIKQSEYKVVDQLRRTPARISILSLLIYLEPHRNVLLKILNQTHVSQDITTDKLGGIVNNIAVDNFISFSDQEIPREGNGHINPLHISVMFQDCVIGKILIDNGSSLNVMTKRTLSRLPVNYSHMRPSAMIVKAFDGSKREVMREIELPIKIGPCTFQILFQVMDINPTYNCLLGMPWIQAAGAVPSTLHQQIKFIINGKLLIIMGEEDMLVSRPFDTLYIEAVEEVLETSFQALEIANTTFVEEASMIGPHLGLEGYHPGKGLGKHGQGVEDIMMPMGNKSRFGLGYNPTKADKTRIKEEAKRKGWAHMGQFEYKNVVFPIPHTKPNFVSAGSENESENNDHINNHSYNFDHPINLVGEEDSEDDWETSLGLLRLVEHEGREIEPHDEPIELINLET